MMCWVSQRSQCRAKGVERNSGYRRPAYFSVLHDQLIVFSGHIPEFARTLWVAQIIFIITFAHAPGIIPAGKNIPEIKSQLLSG